MDTNISLNISNKPNNIQKKKIEVTKNKFTKIKKNKQNNNEFSFEFTKNSKIKAVVARRRSKPLAKNDTNVLSNINLKIIKEKPPAKLNFVRRPSDSNENVMPQNGDMETNLSLNVTKGNFTLREKKIKLSRDERLNLKRNERYGQNNKKNDRVLTEPESKDVPRRRSNPFAKNDTNILSNKNHKPKEKPPVKRNFVRRPSDSNENVMPQNGDIETNLSLNVTKGNVVSLKEKKIKLSRDARLNLKRNERYGQKNKKNDRVLTEQEIKDGMKKFSQLPEKAIKSNATTKSTIKRVNLFKSNPETKLIGQRLVKPHRETVFSGNNLDTLNLHAHCIKNLADIFNITELTTVQQKTIPHVLAGKNLLVRSQTGSGKTLAYALPMVQQIQEIRPKITRNTGILVVIIVPTRELALQTYEIMIKLLKPYQWIVPGFLTGGEKRKAEKARLRKGINLLVGTPGRLVDHLLHTESFKLNKTQMLILDEADRLLELGYERDVKQIVEAINDHRNGIFKREIEGKIEDREEDNCVDNFEKSNVDLQILLLSATLTSAVQQLAGLTLKDPLFIDNSDEDPRIQINNSENYNEAVQCAVSEGKLVIPENLQLSYILVPPKLRLVTLSSILAKEKKENKVMLFMATMEMVNFHHDLLNETLTQKVIDDEDEFNESENDEEPLLKGIKFFKLHGSLSQQERSGVFRAFKQSKSGILITTDVAGRGIDVPEVDLIIQYSPPQKISDFVHRVGRTARAGRSGRAVLFLGPGETDFVRMLEDKRIRISQIVMDGYLDILKNSDPEAHSTQEAASNLQHKFEELIREDKEMQERASKAFVSWIKNYSTFPKELKPIFNIKLAHMGHYAKSFALRDPPANFAGKHSTPKPQLPNNRLTYTERDQPRTNKFDKKTNQKQRLGTKVGFDGERRGGNNLKRGHTHNTNDKMNKFSQKSMALSVSEFGSGIPAKKMKK